MDLHVEHAHGRTAVSRFAGRRARYDSQQVVTDPVPIASTDFTGLALGPSGALPGGVTYTRTSATQRALLGLDGGGNLVVSSANIAANTPSIEDRGLGLGRGLALYPGVTNKPITGFGTPGFVTGSHGPGFTAAQADPAGGVTGIRFLYTGPTTDYTEGNGDFATGIIPSTAPCCNSFFLKHANGTPAATQFNVYNTGPSGTPVKTDAGATVWARFDLPTSAVGGNSGHRIGVTAAATPNGDFTAAFANITVGTLYPVPTFPTLTALTSTDGRATAAIGSGVQNAFRAGPQNLVFRFIAGGGSSEQVAIWYACSYDGNTFIRVDNVAKTLTVSSQGTSFTFSTRGIYFNRDRLELWVRFGGGVATRAAYRIIGGPRYDLGSGSVLPDVAGGVSAVKLVRADDESGYFGCELQGVDAYAMADVPGWVSASFTASSTYVPSVEQQWQIARYGNSRVAAQNNTLFNTQAELPSHLTGWTGFNFGRSAFSTQDLLPLAAADIDSQLDMKRFLRVFTYQEIINGINNLGHTAAAEWALIQSMYAARVAAGWNFLIYETAPLCDPARNASFGGHNADFQACSALMRAGYAAHAASLGVPAVLFDLETNSIYANVTDTTINFDGVHHTALAYTLTQAAFVSQIMAIPSPPRDVR